MRDITREPSFGAAKPSYEVQKKMNKLLQFGGDEQGSCVYFLLLEKSLLLDAAAALAGCIHM